MNVYENYLSKKKKKVYKVQIARVKFVNMRIRFISKQAFHTILDAISPPSDLFLAITSVLCHYHFPGSTSRDFLYMFFVYILHIAKTTRKVSGPRFTIFKELYLLFYSFPPLSTSFNMRLLDKTSSFISPCFPLPKTTIINHVLSISLSLEEFSSSFPFLC